ncbi:zinc finger, CCHC-type containing protein [Tanacetum coccineum]
MILTEATEEEATRKVHATHEQIVKESDPEPARRRPSGIAFRDTSNVSKKISPDPSQKLKGIQTMTAEEQLAADTMRALKANKKSSRSQSHAGGSSEGTGTKPGVLDESTVILTTSHEGTGIKPGVPDEVDWLYFDEDEEKKDDADDDKSIDLKETDNEETDDEFVHGDEYVQENVDEEMKDAEVDDTGNGDEEITDTTKAYTEKTEEVKDDNNIKLQLIFGNLKDTTDAEINSLLDVQIQQEIPYIQSSSILNVHVLVISKSAVLSPIPKIPTVTLTTTPPPPHYVSAISHVLYEVLENQLLSVSLLICLGKRDCVERIPSASNWLERLPTGSITTWEDLTTRFLDQFFPPGRTAKLYNDILMFQQHHGVSLSEAWTHFKDLLQKVPHHGIDLWLQVQIFYDHVDCTTQESINYAAGGRLRQIRPDEAWDTIERLAQYENKGWNNAFTPYEVYFNYENPDVEQLLGIMEHKVDTLMKGAISLMGKSKSIFRLITNEMCRSPIVPSRQEEFEHIVMNFIYDQEERIRELEHYMQDITNEFMEFSSEFALRLKEKIKENKSKPRKIKKITKYLEAKDLENSAKHNFLENLEKKSFPTPASHLCVRCVRLIPSNPSQPRKNIFGFKPGKRDNQSRHDPSNSPTIQPPT